MTTDIYLDSLPSGIRSRRVDNGNGLDMHVLEAGVTSAPPVLLLHGFPELAYSWRKVMPALADAGYRVIAPDQRGYGLTTGWDDAYDTDLGPYRFLNLVRDTMGLLAALGIERVKAVFGHDFGSFAAAHCALIRPDVFQAVALMSAPFGGPPSLGTPPPADIDIELRKLARPRKHYQRYYSTPSANADMRRAPQGVHDFLRAYYHAKSADWAANDPYPLQAWTAAELAKLPTYYVMDADKDMAETVAGDMPTAADIAACAWLPDAELRVYSAVYELTGFQGGLDWYRARFVPDFHREMQTFAGLTVDVPACFISGKADWGTYQVPGVFERMQSRVCTDFRGAHLIPGAGHWVQQEQPDAVGRILIDFLAGL